MEIQKNISLKRYNTFGIDAAAEYFITAHSIEELKEGVHHNEKRVTADGNLLILGGGSNILLTKNVEGLVIKNDILGITKIGEDTDHVHIKAGAGVGWHEFVLYCLDNDYAGVENLALIPGNVGASPMQNIGAYGVEIRDVFLSLEALDVKDGSIVTFNNRDCKFGYRESVFKNKYRGKYIITSVTYRLNKVPQFNTSYGAIAEELEKMNVPVSIRSVANAVMKIRRSKLPDPAVIGNAGSFFKNPEIAKEDFKRLKKEHAGMIGYDLPSGKIKLAAGWLIEQCGWKGFREGDAGCHAKQALVLVNYGNATGAEILHLSENIIASVNEKFGIVLQREVNII